MHYTKMTEEAKAALWEMIAGSERIFITSHRSPDGDSIASTLGLYSAIKAKYPEKNVRVVYTNEPVLFFSQFENYDKIEFVNECSDEIKDSDLVVILDAGQWHRVSKTPDAFLVCQKTICIDHHVSPPDTFTLSIIDTDSPSCGQLVYQLVDKEHITSRLAETFLIGILGDTGNLSYVKPNQGETFLIVQKLLEICKLSIDQFQSQFGAMSQTDFKTLQEFIKNMSFGEIPGYKPFSWSYIGREYTEEHKLTDSDITAAKNIFTAMFIRSIKDYTWGFTMSPKPDNSVSISFRSVAQGQNVRLIAESIGGGGHDAAAGCNIAEISDPLKAFELVTEKMREIINS